MHEGSATFHPLQILLVRMVITYACCMAYMYITKTVPDAPFGKPAIRKWLLFRGTIGFVGVFGMYFSLLYLSLSDAVAITFLIPLVTAFLAFVVLRERYSVLEGVCSVISLAGVVLIAKPAFLFGKNADESGDESVESSSTTKRLVATCVGLFGVLGASSVYIVLRKIGTEAHPLISVSYFALSTVIVSTVSIILIPSVLFVLPETLFQWSLFIAIGIAGFVYQFCMTAGVQRVKASKASLVIYSQMVFAIGMDVIIWHHAPGMLSLLGIVVIVGCTLVVSRDRRSRDGDEARDRPRDLRSRDLESGSGHDSDIEMERFIIDDEGDEDKVGESDRDVGDKEVGDVGDRELNSVKYSQKIKLNIA